MLAKPRFILTVASTIGFASALWAGAPGQPKFYDDDPLWRDPDPLAVASPRSRKLSDDYDFLENTFRQKAELQSRAGAIIGARGVNTLGEVPDSGWYTNRHYYHPMTIDALVRGPGNEHAPSPDGRWRIVAAKNEGVRPDSPS